MNQATNDHQQAGDAAEVLSQGSALYHLAYVAQDEGYDAEGNVLALFSANGWPGDVLEQLIKLPTADLAHVPWLYGLGWGSTVSIVTTDPPLPFTDGQVVWLVCARHRLQEALGQSSDTASFAAALNSKPATEDGYHVLVLLDTSQAVGEIVAPLVKIAECSNIARQKVEEQ